MRHISWIALVASVTAACGSDEPAAPSEDPQPATIAATPQLTFDPGELRVTVNERVTWDFEAVPHNVFFAEVPGRPADIPGFNSSTSASRTFTSEGRFDYECRIHPGMRGTVIVEGGESSVAGAGY